jgi:hypothetical protein
MSAGLDPLDAFEDAFFAGDQDQRFATLVTHLALAFPEVIEDLADGMEDQFNCDNGQWKLDLAELLRDAVNRQRMRPAH